MGYPKEENEQIKLANYLDWNKYCWCHVPNGGNRNRVTGAKLKAQGVKRGVPDVFIFDTPPGTNYKGVVIELKRIKGGRVTKEQKEWLQKLEERGWLTKVCRGADAAIDFLEELGWKEIGHINHNS